MSVPLQKRARSMNLPTLPRITGEIILQVFTHRSLQRSHGGTLEDNSDNDRFSILGKVVLDTVVTLLLFGRRPALSAAEIGVRRLPISIPNITQAFLQRWKESMLSDDNFEDWVSGYKLRNKVRCHPQVFSLLSIPGETRNLFYSYVGGVYAESGMDVVEKWVGQLIDRCSENLTIPPIAESMHRMEPPPPAKRLKSEPLTPSKQAFPLFFLSQVPSPPTDLPPPPPKAAINLPNPLAPAQPNLPFLPLFNQAASQRRCIVEYPAEFSGPPHAGKWTVRCVVNGILKGIGTGTSKQVAKEEAARKAYYAMGWT